MPPLDHFDLLAPLYDKVVKAPEQLPIREHLDVDGSGRLLDAGGGTGRIADALSEDFDLILVLDESIPMLKQTAEKDCCQTVAGQTEFLPFRLGAFDRIIIVDALHHLGDQSRSLEELWRSVSPGGRLIVEEPDIMHWGVKLVAVLEKVLLMRSRFLPAKKVARSLEQLGANVQIRYEGYTYWVLADKPR